MNFPALKKILLTLFANFFYLTGLALIIPLSIIIVFSEFVVQGSIALLFLAALFFVLSGAGLVYVATKSTGKTLMSLGITTLIPATLSIILTFVNEQLIFTIISASVENFQKVQPFITRYLEQRIPHSLYLTVGYFVVGLLLLYAGKNSS